MIYLFSTYIVICLIIIIFYANLIFPKCPANKWRTKRSASRPITPNPNRRSPQIPNPNRQSPQMTPPRTKRVNWPITIRITLSRVRTPSCKTCCANTPQRSAIGAKSSATIRFIRSNHPPGARPEEFSKMEDEPKNLIYRGGLNSKIGFWESIFKISGLISAENLFLE